MTIKDYKLEKINNLLDKISDDKYLTKSDKNNIYELLKSYKKLVIFSEPTLTEEE